MKYYIWIILIILYIISPRDLITPSFIDDLVALAMMAYLMYKKRKTLQNRSRKDNKQYSQKHEKQKSHEKEENTRTDEHMTVSDAYKVLGVRPDAPVDMIRKAYKEKIVKNHPDKVSHLSTELQEKARQLTVIINRAYELIKKERNF
jgi:DnaJ-domain-containing protein 1